ncbi:hypothetical protein FRC12_018859 [Ceratobasidium sp. 428]|nr:hypothetical protein FRC12_018859 [Ceratobasidium sp. 428]
MATNLGNSSSFAEIGTTINFALNEWKHACALLSNTINLYVSACATLKTTCAVPVHRSSGYPEIEEVLVTVDSNLELLELEEEKLRSTRALLTTLRNNSTTLARVNKLPQEILSHVFVLAKSHCVHDEDFGSHDPAAVCSYWRRIAMNTPNLRSHIDIGSGSPERLVRLSLDRTKDHPIHIHVHEVDTNPPGTGFARKAEAEKVVELLEPHIHRVRALNVRSQSKFSAFTSTMLKFWLRRGNSRFSKSLIVSRPTANGLLHLHSSNKNKNEFSPNVRDVLLSLNKLHLQSVMINWDSNTYQSLIDLRLDFTKIRVSIPVSQFASILSASPAISTIKLGGINITGAEEWNNPGPIVLASLKVLKLFGMESHSLRIALSMIGLPDSPVELSISFMGDSDMHDELMDFFRGARITTLHLRSHKAGSGLSPACLPLSELHTIILEDHQWVLPLVRGSGPTSSQSTSLFPRLTAILLQCQIEFECLKLFVGSFGVQELRLEQCVPAYRDDLSLDAMGSLLLGEYPRIWCYVSDAIDSTFRLPCRTVLDD